MPISQQALVSCSGLFSPVLHVVSFFLSRLDNKRWHMKLKLLYRLSQDFYWNFFSCCFSCRYIFTPM